MKKIRYVFILYIHNFILSLYIKMIPTIGVTEMYVYTIGVAEMYIYDNFLIYYFILSKYTTVSLSIVCLIMVTCTLCIIHKIKLS